MLGTVIFFFQLQVHLINGLTCQVNSKNVTCLPRVCPGDLVTLTYNDSVDTGSDLWRFPNRTCSNASIPNAIVIDVGPPTTCNGQSGICGPFSATNVNGGGTGPCFTSILTVRIGPTVQSPVHIQVGTRTIYGIENITNSTDLIVIGAPGYPNISVTSGLTNLIITWTASPSGGPPDHYNVALMNGSTAVYDQKNITGNQCFISNLSSNALYEVNVTAINCASFNTSTWSAYTLSNPPSDIKAVKQSFNQSGINLTLSWIHIGGTVSSYEIALKCCQVRPLVANVSQYCNDMACSYSQYIAVNNLTLVTVSSVNPGGVGPESKSIEVIQSEGSSKLVTEVTVPIGVCIFIALCVVVAATWCCWPVPEEIIIIHDKTECESDGSQSGTTCNYEDITITLNLPESVTFSSKELRTKKIRRYKTFARQFQKPVSSSFRHEVTEEERKYVKDRLRSTMNDVIDFNSITVSRNWAPLLYYKYRRTRGIFRSRNTPLNEMIMFRGTNATSTEYVLKNGYSIPADSDLGEGVYFAKDASYAAMYSYTSKKRESRKELTLALLITGDSTKENLDEINVNPDTGRQYDSSMNEKMCSFDSTKKGFLCAVKDIDQSYPLYIITYTVVTAQTTYM